MTMPRISSQLCRRGYQPKPPAKGEVLGPIQPLLRYPSNCFLTSVSFSGDILHYLLASGTESSSKPMFYSSLRWYAWRFRHTKKLTRDLLIIWSISTWYLGTIPSPQCCQHPIGVQKRERVQQANHAGQPCLTSASTFFKLNRATLAILLIVRSCKMYN